ncbi:hypothetical protein U2F26_29925 [Micromonospora sp. 4G57]|uniref:WXG100 family type VII secretion target n=1 Tax=Micromonospora sicca TaxID=2202420 RepID=A0ABU5JLX1_9ACTN|nr:MULTISPECIES: hypothetical protein [unclassified Micromonospora]MDZ5446898.1 hypothetical protein [Micromonospora sp. 4G57]MDZ5493576.1 hypothetical protein [Micromonospora sp. 4G53]
MTMEGPIRQVETARAELSKVASSTEGWSDKQRHTFDSQRMKPLDTAGGRLLSAMQKAHEQCARAERLLSGR